MTVETAAIDPTRGSSPSTVTPQMRAFLEHTKCPPLCVDRIRWQPLLGSNGFFKFGGLRLYGRVSGGAVSANVSSELFSVDSFALRDGGSISLPFDPTEVIENMRLEKYLDAVNSEIDYISDNKSFSRRVYYALRPLLPVTFRRILQRIALKDWAKIPFPRWPLDTTVEDLVDQLWVLALDISREKQIPFIWYWPKGFESCAIMTHDVETGPGQDFCHRMLELENEYGIKSAFELVPEVRYIISEQLVEAIRNEGSEVCIHGLNHDGRLFSSEAMFRSRAEKINQYARQLGATGFRSPVMYRNQAWYDAFEISYDMSVPNAAQLDPQRGGCCTIFPYFIGKVLELPLTTIQDYPLYNILRSDPIEMWAKQLEMIAGRHGMASFIIHPDYTVPEVKQALYRKLLALLSSYRARRKMWLALPGEVDKWWRQRNAMTLVCEGGKWTIQGEGSDRATVAYARVEDGKLRFVIGN